MTWCLNISPIPVTSFQSHPFLQHWEDGIAARTVALEKKTKVNRIMSYKIKCICSELAYETTSETLFFHHRGIMRRGGNKPANESEQTDLCWWWGSVYAVSPSVWTPCCVLVRCGSTVHFQRWCHTLEVREARRHPPEGRRHKQKGI